MFNLRRAMLLALAGFAWMPAPASSQSPAKPMTVVTTPAATTDAATKPVRKQSAFKDDPTRDPRDRELDRRIRSICRGC